MKNRKALSLLLVLAMLLSLLSISAFAASGTFSVGTNVNSISLSGAGAYSVTTTPETFTSNSFNNTRFVYDIVLPSSVSDTETITITFDATDDTVISPVPPQGAPAQYIPMIKANASDTYTVTLSAGSGSRTVYAHHNIDSEYQHADIYIFNFSKGTLNNPVEAGNGLKLRFGDPSYELTAPECYMSFIGSGSAYTVDYVGPLGDTSTTTNYAYYPDTLALYIANPSGITAMTAPNDNITMKVYNTAGDLLESNTTLSTNKTAGFYTLELASGSSAAYVLNITNDSGTVALTFRAPKAYQMSSGSAPEAITSYLPLGQYASGVNWGSYYTDGAMFTSDTYTVGTTQKFVSGFSSTGVSLGAFGGYIEFDFGEGKGIENNNVNPYGVDFVVYGNAFTGNPEAGAVQVSEDGTTWYELAGSLYYDGGFAATNATQSSGKFSAAYTGTMRNAGVTYTLTDSDINATLTDGSTSLTASPFTSTVAWWPTTTEYTEFANYATDTNGNAKYSGITYGASSLAFSGLTAVEDSNTTAFYAFGYADVTPNGSPSTYGDATNPYLAAASKTGGDGFDLEWAVDENGNPVDVSDKAFRYVRVYSAVLDNATFGETSTEVCGIFTTANPAASPVNRTAMPTITVDDGDEFVVGDITEWAEASLVGNGDTVVYDLSDWGLTSLTVNAELSGANVYVNSSTTGTYTANASDGYVRVIAQSGTAAPRIVLIKLA